MRGYNGAFTDLIMRTYFFDMQFESSRTPSYCSFSLKYIFESPERTSLV